jgi:energy-coupling factor transporter ATP-binding protein EcfA2
VAELIVVTGPPGAGKSTVAKSIARMFGLSALVAGDSFFGFLDQGAVPPWLPEANGQNRTVIRAAASAAGALADGGYTVVFDGVVGPWLLPEFAITTGLDRLHYVVLMPEERLCVQRVKSRVGHGFTDLAATRHMYAQFADAALDRRHLLMRPPDDPEATAAIIVGLMGRGELANTSAG